MVEGKFVRGKQSKKSLFTRLTEKLTSQSHCPTRDQSVQTSLNPSATATVLLNHRLNVTPSSRPRLSLRTFLLAYSPKSITFKSRARRRSTNIKTSKGTTSHSLQVALVRKIPCVHQFNSPLTNDDETGYGDEWSSIGPLTWSTPNQAALYRTSSPNGTFDQAGTSCSFDQLSFSTIFDCID